MKALVLGGTSGLGSEITTSLVDLGYHILTVSRQNKIDANHYSCDLGNGLDTLETFRRIKQDQSSLDLIVCVAGYALPTKLEEQTSRILDEHIIRNLGYVDLAFDQFRDTLSKSERPTFVTIGSQWSVKVRCNDLLPYISAKHALRLFTQQKAMVNPWIKMSNYCVPTMNTPACQGVRVRFSEIYPHQEQKIFSEELANPATVAQSLVSHLVDKKSSSGIYIISKQGELQEHT